jgi:hypothetical protein
MKLGVKHASLPLGLAFGFSSYQRCYPAKGDTPRVEVQKTGHGRLARLEPTVYLVDVQTITYQGAEK